MIDTKETSTTAQDIANIIEPLATQGILLPKTALAIESNQNDWIIQRDENNEIIGFAEFRHPVQGKVKDYAEMGSVVSLQSGTGRLLLTAFETKRRTLNIAQGCAITKSQTTAEFFQIQTNGVISKNFPEWFNREKDDRFFVSWS